MSVKTIAEALTAFGTVAVAAVAIWGDRIKDRLFGPRLKLSLLDAMGDLTRRQNGIEVFYYHIRVTNRPHSLAKSVQVLVQRVSRRVPGGTFQLEKIVYPLPLVWTPMELFQLERKVVAVSTCDFGFLDSNAPAFKLATVVTPNNFHGDVTANQSARFELMAVGENVYFSKPIVLEVSWDGKWVRDREQMQKHLVITQVASLI
jgi:hypothetical protein